MNHQCAPVAKNILYLHLKSNDEDSKGYDDESPRSSKNLNSNEKKSWRFANEQCEWNLSSLYSD